MKDVKRFHKRIETRLKSKKVFTIISTKKLKLKSVIPAMLDYPGSICIKDIEKANGFMYIFKEVFAVDNGQLLIFLDKKC